jgi:hypothetical protein
MFLVFIKADEAIWSFTPPFSERKWGDKGGGLRRLLRFFLQRSSRGVIPTWL